MKSLRAKFVHQMCIARKACGWTQVELAKRTGIHPCAISHFETAQRMPSLQNFDRLVNAFSKEISYIDADFLLGRK